MSVFHDLAVQWGERYRKMSIQMVLSLSFTAVAAAGILLMGGSLIWRFTSSTEKLVAENSQRVLAQANLSLDSYLRRMMRIADTARCPSSTRRTGTTWSPWRSSTGRGA